MPLIRSKLEDRPSSVPAVTDTDAAIDEVCHLDAVAVREAQRALNPDRIRIRLFEGTFERRPSHVCHLTELIVGFRPAYNYRAWPCATTLRSYPPWSLSDITCSPESQLLISNHDYDPAVQTGSGARSSNRSNRGTPREPAAAKRCCRLALLHVGPLASP
jgi:hypothetical protein